MSDSLRNLEGEDDLREQIDELLRGVIEPNKFQQLQDRLKSDPSARQLYLAEFEVESMLGGGLRDNPQKPIFPNANPSGTPLNSTTWFSQNSFLSFCILALAVLSAATLTWSSGIFALPNNSPPLLSKLQPLSKGCEWYVEKSRGKQVAGSCRIGDVIRVTMGQLAVIYPTGTRVVLQSPAANEWTSTSSAKMLVGRLTATVSVAGIGFTVITPKPMSST